MQMSMAASLSSRLLPVASVPHSSPAAAYLPSRHRLLPCNRSIKFDVKCSYSAGLSVTEDFRPRTRDFADDRKSQRIVVLGGSGFIGSSICKVAVSKGMEVTSLSRSGRPALPDPWVNQVNWVIGDVFNANWDEVLAGATAVVTTVGGFGSEEHMLRINGEANVVAVNAAKKHGIRKYVMISIHDHNLPQSMMQFGYFTGKRRAEAEILSNYPHSGVIFRPGLVYGKRQVLGVEILVDLLGEPVEKILEATENITRPLSIIPGSDLILAPPVHVDDLAYAVYHALTDDDFFGIFTIQHIKEASAKVKVQN